jgi:hypothetical protein
VNAGNKKQTRLTGLEPVTFGSVDRRCKNVTTETTKICKTAKQQLTPESSKQPKIDTAELPSDLAEIVAAWPELPEPVKAGILAMVQASKP